MFSSSTPNEQITQPPIPIARAGNIGNYVLLGSTSIITACMISKFPNETYFDPKWLRSGFCVSNESSFWWNSHTMSFYADALFTVIIAYLYATQPKYLPTLQVGMLSGAIMAVFGHGCGHLYLGMEPTGMDLRLRFHTIDDFIASIPTFLVSFFGFGSIFKGTMPLATIQHLAVSALIASLGFNVLNIEPTNNFIYAQAAIYVSSALHMLSLSEEQKNTAAYSLYPWFQLPVLAIGVLESTACQSILEPLGGHVIFDSIIALGIIMNEVISRSIEKKRGKEKALKSI